MIISYFDIHESNLGEIDGIYDIIYEKKHRDSLGLRIPRDLFFTQIHKNRVKYGLPGVALASMKALGSENRNDKICKLLSVGRLLFDREDAVVHIFCIESINELILNGRNAILHFSQRNFLTLHLFFWVDFFSRSLCDSDSAKFGFPVFIREFFDIFLEHPDFVQMIQPLQEVRIDYPFIPICTVLNNQ